jgi:uncharacterized protein YheU (UPF0270 family)
MDKYAFVRYLFVLAALTVGMAGTVSGESRDFRDVSWGMSRLEVMAHEKDAPVSFKEPYIHYRSRIGGQDLHLIYGFVEDKLVNAVYIVVTRDPKDYRYFKKTLEKKYGRPKKAMDEGSSKYLFFWNEKRTAITIKPGNIRECRIEYQGIKFRGLRAKKEKQRRNKMADELFWAY